VSKQAYPLSWPEGWKRTAVNNRKRAQFNKKERQYRGPSVPGGQGTSWVNTKDLSVADGVERVLRELSAMGVDRQDVIISTNIRTRLDGLPRSGDREPDDPGAAIYWRSGKEPMRSMAIDRYDRVADNLAALGATLEAMRAIERHGGAEILQRAFLGFAALPEKASQGWRPLFGFGEDERVSSEQVEKAFRELAKKHHPDTGGNVDKFQEILNARENARRDLQDAVA
jgi:hypothetical protein